MVVKNVDYGEIITSSIDMMKKNVILFVPNILMVLVSILLLTIFIHGSGIVEMFAMRPYLIEDTTALRSAFASMSTSARFIISLTVFIIGEMLIGAFFAVMKFGMIRDVIKKKKTSLRSGADFAEKNYFNYLVIHLVSMAIIFLPLFVLLFVYLLIVSTTEYVTLGAFMLGIFAIVWVAYAILMTIRLFFVYPTMTFEKEKYLKSISKEFHFVKTHMGHTFISFLIVTIVVFGFAIVREGVEIVGFTVSGITILAILAFITTIMEILITTWEHIFVFKSYEERRHLDKLTKK